MARALVTGAGGFIGQHLVAALIQRGHHVTGLLHAGSRRARPTIDAACFIEGDVTDRDSVADAVAQAKPEAVYHLAGITRALDRQAYLDVNEKGCAHVAAACAALDSPPTLVVVSSLAAGGPCAPDRPRTEADAPAPVSHYGASKLAGEVAASRSADHLPLSIVRPPVVFGAPDPATFKVLRPVARRGLHIVAGPRGFRVSLIHVSDLVEALLAVVERGRRVHPGQAAGCGIYYVAHEEAPALADFGRMVGQAMGRRVRVVRVPNVLLRAAGCAAQGIGRLRRRALPINPDKVRELLARSWCCSPDKARRELGFDPPPLRTRLRQTIDDYRAMGWL